MGSKEIKPSKFFIKFIIISALCIFIGYNFACSIKKRTVVMKAPIGQDQDGDGLPDTEEMRIGTNPTKSDTDNDGINDYDEVNASKGYKTNPTKPDTDGDGLNDDKEFSYFCNPTDSDTDGDGFLDGDEIYKEPWEVGSGNKCPYKPTVVDISFKIKSIKFVLNKKFEISEEKYSVGENELIVDKGYELSIETKTGVKGTLESRISTNPLDIGASAKIEAYQNIELNTSGVFSKKWSERTLSAERYYTQRKVNLSNSKMKILLNIKNIGDKDLNSTLKDIKLNIFIGNDKDPYITVPVNYVFENIEKKDDKDVVVEFKVDYDFFTRVQAGEGLDVRIMDYSFGEDQRNLNNIKKRCIQVYVDSGNEQERHYIIPPQKELTFLDICKLSKVPVILSKDNSKIISIKGKKNLFNQLPLCYWTLFVGKITGKKSYSVNEIRLQRGDKLFLKYNIDTDGDGLTDIDELRLGTKIDEKDTDGDGLIDGYTNETLNLEGELNHSANPLSKDSDNDWWTDGIEVKENTKPNDPKEHPLPKEVPPDAMPDGRIINFLSIPLHNIHFRDGDVLAIGNVVGDEKTEIIHGSSKDGTIGIYSYLGNKIKQIDANVEKYNKFKKGDFLAVANINESSKKEILHVHFVWFGSRITTFTFLDGDNIKGDDNVICEIGKNDYIATGNIDGEDPDEIIHVEIPRLFEIGKERRISICEFNGSKPRLLNTIAPKCGFLCVGEINGEDPEEIIFSNKDGGITIYNLKRKPFKSKLYLSHKNIVSFHVGDTNGDQIQEIIYNENTNRYQTYNISTKTKESFYFKNEEGAILATGDLNNDGLADFLYGIKGKIAYKLIQQFPN